MSLLTSKFDINDEEAKIIGNRVAVLLARGNFDAAHNAVTMAEFSIQDKPNAVLHDVPLAQSTLNVRLLNLLECYQIYTFGHLAGRTIEWFISLPNAGDVALSELQDVIAYESSRRRQ
jgi:predicted phosphodiesterase